MGVYFNHGVLLAMDRLDKYKAIVFDCDGVILDSNKIKTEAFRFVADQFGAKSAQLLVDFHVKNGGISRYKKFEYLLSNILCRKLIKSEVDDLAEQFSKLVYQGLLACPMASGLHELREKTDSAKWFIASGADQEELRRVFSARGISDYFNGGIYGSPTSKDDILVREIANGNLESPTLFLGDSRYDHQVANSAGLDFIFISRWSEFKDWKKYCKINSINSVSSISDILYEL